jgi:hypothetical protein
MYAYSTYNIHTHYTYKHGEREREREEDQNLLDTRIKNVESSERRGDVLRNGSRAGTGYEAHHLFPEMKACLGRRDSHRFCDGLQVRPLRIGTSTDALLFSSGERRRRGEDGSGREGDAGGAAPRGSGR